jgi:hypothetical protein
MKTNFKSIGPVELEKSDLAEALIFWAKKSKDNAKEFTKIITSYLEEDMKMVVNGIQRENDFSKIVANVEVTQNSGVDFIGTPYKAKEEKKEKKSNEGFVRKNKGFYSMVADIIADYQKKGKASITFEEISKELTFDFGRSMELWRIKQYLTPSQIVKNAAKSLKGVKRTPDDDGLMIPKGKA